MNISIELKGSFEGFKLMIPEHYVGKHKRALSKVIIGVEKDMNVQIFILDHLEDFANALFELIDKDGNNVVITREVVDNLEVTDFDLVKEKVNDAITVISGVKKKDKMKSENTIEKPSQPKEEVQK